MLWMKNLEICLGGVPADGKKRECECKVEMGKRPEGDAAGRRPGVCIYSPLCLVPLEEE